MCVNINIHNNLSWKQYTLTISDISLALESSNRIRYPSLIYSILLYNITYSKIISSTIFSYLSLIGIIFEMRLLNLRINFYLLLTFFPHLGSFLCCLFFHYISAKFHLWPSSGDLPRPRIRMLSLVTVSPVITAFILNKLILPETLQCSSSYYYCLELYSAHLSINIVKVSAKT